VIVQNNLRASAQEQALGIRTPLFVSERLVQLAQELSVARELEAIMAVVRRAARELTGADGATFVLREGNYCVYASEDAISPLWKGRRFPLDSCISGWVMLHEEPVVIEDIYADPRIPHAAYRPTFVKSLAMVPIRRSEPVGAIGAYWASRHCASDGDLKALRALADLSSVAMENLQLYTRLQTKIREAQAAVRARDDFLSVASHELRTPLTAMLLQLQRLEQLLAVDQLGERYPKLANCAARSTLTGKRLAALVDGLLDASRLAQGPIPLDVEGFDLVQATREVLDGVATTAKHAGCDLRLDAAAPLQGRWDRRRIEQVLTNLLSNALKYGAGKPIDILIAPRDGQARVEVRDHGLGMAPEVAGKIFERFGRAGPVAHHGGLGLGLYLSREAVEAHGGAIRFESRPGDGCTFVVTLPLRRSES
jgi:two-component system CheB/CheR fusion protein